MEELKEWLERVPELALVLEVDENDSPNPKQAINDLISADREKISQACKLLYARLKKNSTLRPEEEWVLKLEQEYPAGDSGIFCFFVMKYLCLETGEAIYIGPNIPHAYLKGELAECMANSDNVVRAGLTPKFKDTEALLYMLNQGPLESCLLDKEQSTSTKALSSYRPPVSEFSLDLLQGSVSDLGFNTNHSAEIVFVLKEEAAYKLSSQAKNSHLEQLISSRPKYLNTKLARTMLRFSAYLSP